MVYSTEYHFGGFKITKILNEEKLIEIFDENGCEEIEATKHFIDKMKKEIEEFGFYVSEDYDHYLFFDEKAKDCVDVTPLISIVDLDHMYDVIKVYNPVTHIRAERWYKTLSPELKSYVDALVNK